MKKGQVIKYRRAYILYKYIGDENPDQGVEIITATYLGRPGKGKYIDFSPDVCDYIVDNGMVVGVSKNQIIEEGKP